MPLLEHEYGRFSFFLFLSFVSFLFSILFFSIGSGGGCCCGSPVVTGFPLRGVINRVGGMYSYTDG